MAIPEEKFPRNKHATISVITHVRKDFESIDEYLSDCEQRYHVGYIKQMSSTGQAWEEAMKSMNAEYNFRGKNIVLECLQCGGNHEFWSGFESEQDIRNYFDVCYNYAVHTIGFLHTHENIICAVIVTEPNRRNLFVYYLPVTEVWREKIMSGNKSKHEKIMSDNKSKHENKLQLRDEYGTPVYRQRIETDNPRLCHSEFWKARGGLVSYSALQEDFYQTVSERYGAARGESYSLIKNTVQRQRERYNRTDGDRYDELYYDGF